MAFARQHRTIVLIALAGILVLVAIVFAFIIPVDGQSTDHMVDGGSGVAECGGTDDFAPAGPPVKYHILLGQINKYRKAVSTSHFDMCSDYPPAINLYL